METQLVTVLCLCFNQKQFVQESIESVINQTYKNIELIVMDDGSTDGSQALIESLLKKHPQIKFISHSINQGYCKTLNEGVELANGKFIIDLAADDILLPKRVKAGVEALMNLHAGCDLQFTDAILMDEIGKSIGYHSNKFPHHTIPQGDIYSNLIDRYFICSPTLMFKKSVVTAIGGYDETLAFEDFDFLIRASRQFNFCYSATPLIKRRVIKTSMSSKQFIKGSDQRWSTFEVCKKIYKLNKTRAEHAALKRRIRYEILLSIKLADLRLAIAFLKFYFRLSSPNTMLL